MNAIIKEFQSRKEIMSAFPVIKQLLTHFDEGSYLESVTEAQNKDGYKCLPLP